MVSLTRIMAVRERRGWDRGVLAIILIWALCLPLLTPRVYAVDSVEYYVYLRSLLFDGDLNFTNDYTHFDELNPNAGIAKALLNRRDPITGNPINLAPIGTSILWAPAFLGAHVSVMAARAFGINVAADGYSYPYIFAIAAATAIYGLLGLLLSYRIARRYTRIWPATIATIVCCLASPLVFFMYVSPPWSHVPAFFMTAAFISYWLRTRPSRTFGQWIVLGLFGGLMTLCREQLGLFMLLPAIDGLSDYWTFLRARQWQNIRVRFTQHCLFLVIIALTLIPQFLAYRSLNGRWGPSTIVSDKLSLWSSHFFGTLIDPAHGAFMWTPIWAVGMVGLVLLWKHDRVLTLLFGLVLFAQIYVNGAFGTTWHLTGSFGFRRLLEATPIFVLGTALVFERIRIPRSLLAALCVLLIVWNFGLIAQWSLPPRPIKDGLVWNGMLQRQLAIPQTATSKLWTLIFERCKLVQNGGC